MTTVMTAKRPEAQEAQSFMWMRGGRTTTHAVSEDYDSWAGSHPGREKLSCKFLYSEVHATSVVATSYTQARLAGTLLHTHPTAVVRFTRDTAVVGHGMSSGHT